MLFEVVRTSIRGDELPHPRCKMISLTRVEKFKHKSAAEFDNELWGTPTPQWLKVGTNHRYDKDGCIMRDNGTRETWGIEINSLEKLLDFWHSTEEEIVLRVSWIDETTPCLEIYDDYRE